MMTTKSLISSIKCINLINKCIHVDTIQFQAELISTESTLDGVMWNVLWQIVVQFSINFPVECIVWVTMSKWFQYFEFVMFAMIDSCARIRNEDVQVCQQCNWILESIMPIGWKSQTKTAMNLLINRNALQKVE